MRRTVLPLLTLLLSGCVLGPQYRRPDLNLPPQFRGQAAPETASLADLAWWEVFGDPALNTLQAEALRSNFDVRTAAWRVEEFRALAGISRSYYSPLLTPQILAERGRLSGYESGGGETGNVLEVNLGLSWELDLWGRLKHLNEAARAQFLASEDAQKGVYLSVASDVAEAYFRLRALDAQLEIARRTTRSFEETLDLFNRRMEGGLASSLETSRAEAARATAAAFIPDLERQVAAQENLLCFLLGRPPGPIQRGPGLEAQGSPPAIPAGLPAALLERRPDLRQAEQDLVAANALVGVARADYFPTFSLTGAFGGLSPSASTLFSQGKQWSIGPALTGPLLQGSRLKNHRDQQVARWEQSRIRYEANVNLALREVSSALVAYQKLGEAETEQARAVASHREAVRLANLRYVAGLSSYVEVLDTQTQLFPAENALAQTRATRLSSLVQLYKALGGGWKPIEPKRP